MKIRKAACVLVLTLLCVTAWCLQITHRVEENEKYMLSVEAGESLAEQGLYQRALDSYDTALAIRESAELREKQLAVCEKAYEDGVLTGARYAQMLENACLLYPKRSDFWMQALTSLKEQGDVKSAYKLIKKMNKAGQNDPKLRAESLDVIYAYTNFGVLYSKVCVSQDGYAVVCDADRWGICSPDGEELYACDYVYISPYNDAHDAVFCTETDKRLIDRNDVVQALIRKDFSAANAYGDGLLPLCCDGTWSYYDCATGSDALGPYQNASSFQNGIAAVADAAGWRLIDKSGRTVSGNTYQDVKLHGNGAYYFKDHMVAATAGEGYALYNAEGKKISEFTARDMDVYMGDWLAYQDDNGRWGFVDEKGNIVLKPKYEQAKSFSNGLAAVKIGEKWGFINKKGESAIEPQFAQAGYFTANGTCYVSMQENAFYMIMLRFPEGV